MILRIVLTLVLVVMATGAILTWQDASASRAAAAWGQYLSEDEVEHLGRLAGQAGRDPALLLAVARRAERAGAVDEAIVAYRQAVSARSHDARLHAALADLLGQGAPRFDYHYQQAWRLGPYEAEVQYRLVDAGFRRWLALPPHLRDLAVEVAKAGLGHPSLTQQDRIQRLLEGRGLLSAVCRQMAEPSEFCP